MSGSKFEIISYLMITGFVQNQNEIEMSGLTNYWTIYFASVQYCSKKFDEISV